MDLLHGRQTEGVCIHILKGVSTQEGHGFNLAQTPEPVLDLLCGKSGIWVNAPNFSEPYCAGL